MSTRIYLVAACVAGIAQPPRLIEAGTAAAARNFATKDMLSVKPASAKEVGKLVQSGVKLEIANEAPPEQQPLPGTAEPTGSGPSTDGSGNTDPPPQDPCPVVGAEVGPSAEPADPEPADPFPASNDEAATTTRRRRR